MVDPIVSENLINAWPFARVVVQDLRHDVPRPFSDGHVFWEVVGVHPDSFVGGFDV